MTDKEYCAVSMRETFLKCKDGSHSPCGDALSVSEGFLAVIDGATPKGARTWDGMAGDVFISSLLADAVARLPRDVCAEEAISALNGAVRAQYRRVGLDFDTLPPEERLQASIVIYSVARREVWLFGDCQFLVNGESFTAVRRGDALFADLRALCAEIAKEKGIADAGDYGRRAILPLLGEYMMLSNTDGEFGYDAITGGEIRAEHVQIHPVKPGDLVVLSSDGYPKLFDTLEKTEAYLFASLAEDSACLSLLRGTKGMKTGNESFDDRCYLSFIVE